MDKIQRHQCINDLKTRYGFRKEDLQKLDNEQLKEVVEVLENFPGSRQLYELTLKRLDARCNVNRHQGKINKRQEFKITDLENENSNLKSQLKKTFPTFYNMAIGLVDFFADEAEKQYIRAENIKKFSFDQFEKIEEKSVVQGKIISEYIKFHGQDEFNKIVIKLKKSGDI